MSEGDGGGISRRNGPSHGNSQGGGRVREEAIRNYAGWKCSHCGSGNTIIEEYSRTQVEGYCMSCARTIPIPEEKLHAFRLAQHTRRLH